MRHDKEDGLSEKGSSAREEADEVAAYYELIDCRAVADQVLSMTAAISSAISSTVYVAVLSATLSASVGL